MAKIFRLLNHRAQFTSLLKGIDLILAEMGKSLYINLWRPERNGRQLEGGWYFQMRFENGNENALSLDNIWLKYSNGSKGSQVIILLAKTKSLNMHQAITWTNDDDELWLGEVKFLCLAFVTQA